jgi:hypothetical protein
LIEADLLPDFNLAIIATCCYNTLILGMSPSHLPAWALMSIKFVSKLRTYALTPPKS